MITGINESKILIKHISCKYKGRFAENGNQWCNHDKYPCQCKKRHVCHVYQKDYVWNFFTCKSKNGKYLASIRLKGDTTKKQVLMKRKQPVKLKIYIFQLHFYYILQHSIFKISRNIKTFITISLYN